MTGFDVSKTCFFLQKHTLIVVVHKRKLST